MHRRLGIALAVVTLALTGQPGAGAGATTARPRFPAAALDALDPGYFATTLSPVAAGAGDTLLFNTDTGSITQNGTTTIRAAGVNNVNNGIGMRLNAGGSGVAAFYMANLTVASGATVEYLGQEPLGLLETGDVTINGLVTADAEGALAHTGPGAGSGGNCLSTGAGGGGGAGFAAAGGSGGEGAPASGGTGGPSYGQSDLTAQFPFPVGSGGGDAAAANACSTVSHGGPGGGGIAVVSLGTVDLSGAVVSVRGGQAAATAACSAGGGGGSGGSVLIVGPAYADTNQTTFRIGGGNGGNASSCGAHVGGGGAGAGGRLTVVTGGTRQGVVYLPSPFPGLGAGGGQNGTTGGAPTAFDGSFVGVSGPSSIEAGAPASFDATVEVGQVDSWAWDFGDGTTATTATGSVSHSFPHAGNFTVTATATMSGSGAQSTSSTSTVVSDVPISGLTASNNGPTADGARTRLTATISAGTGVTYSWDFGDGTKGSGRSVLHRYPAPDSYLATVTATNGAGDASAQTEVVVSDPVVSISPASVVEGTAPLPDGKQYTIMKFEIDLSAATNNPVSVNAQTSNGTAVVKRDFKAKFRTVTFAAGTRKAFFTVNVVPDAIPEPNEQFNVTLSAPTNASLGNSSATGTIIDDDGGG